MNFTDIESLRQLIGDETDVVFTRKLDAPLLKYSNGYWSWASNGKCIDPTFVIRDSQYSIDQFIAAEGLEEIWSKTFDPENKDDVHEHYFFISSPDTIKSVYTPYRRGIFHFFSVRNGELMDVPEIKSLDKFTNDDEIFGTKVVNGVTMKTIHLFCANPLKLINKLKGFCKEKRFVVIFDGNGTQFSLTSGFVIGDKTIDDVIGTKVLPFEYEGLRKLQKYDDKIVSQYLAHPEKYGFLNANILSKVMMYCDNKDKHNDTIMQLARQSKANPYHEPYKHLHDVKLNVNALNESIADVLKLVLGEVLENEYITSLLKEWESNRYVTFGIYASDWLDRKDETFAKIDEFKSTKRVDVYFATLKSLNHAIIRKHKKAEESTY